RPSNAAGASGTSRAHRPIPDPLDPDKPNSSSGRPGRPVVGPPPGSCPRGSDSRPARNGEGPAREDSCSLRPGPCGRSTDRRAESEAGDLVEVGDQVRLLILLDRPPAPGESALLEFDPGARLDGANADWGESSSLLPVRIFDVLAPELAFHGRGQPVDDRGPFEVVFLDQQ